MEPFDTGELRNAAAALVAAKFCKPCARIFGGNSPCFGHLRKSFRIRFTIFDREKNISKILSLT